MQCTNRSIKSYISEKFKYEYVSRMGMGSVLFHISTFGSNIIFWHTSGGDSKSRRYIQNLHLKRRSFLGSCSGLHLLLLGGRLCVRSPLTCTSTLLDLSQSKLLPHIITFGYKCASLKLGKANCIGFAVDQIKQQFKIVCVNETTWKKFSDVDEEEEEEIVLVYQFEITTGDSCWRLSETRMTTTTCVSSKLMGDKKPAYFNGYVHWLRENGSILAFNMETEVARLIPTKLPQEQAGSEVRMLAATENKLTLITETEQVVCVYALIESILKDDDDDDDDHHPEWVIMKRYEKRERVPAKHWNVAAYDKECLMLREKEDQDEEEEEEGYNGVVHVLDLEPHENYLNQKMIITHIDGISSYDLRRLQGTNVFGKRSIVQVEPPKLRMVSKGSKKRKKSPLL